MPRATTWADKGAAAIKRMVFVKGREQKQGKESHKKQADRKLYDMQKECKDPLEQANSEGRTTVQAHRETKEENAEGCLTKQAATHRTNVQQRPGIAGVRDAALRRRALGGSGALLVGIESHAVLRVYCLLF